MKEVSVVEFDVWSDYIVDRDDLYGDDVDPVEQYASAENLFDLLDELDVIHWNREGLDS